MGPQWTKKELEDWCLGFCRTPHTTLKAFIDAGFCSDQEPSRDELRLWPKPDSSTVDATKPVITKLRDVIFEVLGDELFSAYDCTRVWEAWSIGTMGKDDFLPVCDRLHDIVDAIICEIYNRHN